MQFIGAEVTTILAIPLATPFALSDVMTSNFL